MKSILDFLCTCIVYPLADATYPRFARALAGVINTLILIWVAFVAFFAIWGAASLFKTALDSLKAPVSKLKSKLNDSPFAADCRKKMHRVPKAA